MSNSKKKCQSQQTIKISNCAAPCVTLSMVLIYMHNNATLYFFVNSSLCYLNSGVSVRHGHVSKIGMVRIFSKILNVLGG